MFRNLILFVLFHSSATVINGLNDSDHARMPPLFHLDNYEECFDEPDSMYCFAEFALVSDEPSELLTMIKEYTNKGYANYNRTVLRHGFCMKKTCSNFYVPSESDLDLKSSLEACTNGTIYKKYKLKTKLSNDVDCSKRDRDFPIDNLDLAVGVVCIVILIVNLIASLCDRYLKNGRDREGLRFLCCFSIFWNWKKLVASPGEGQDPRVKALKGIHGIRSFNTYLVLTGHSFIFTLAFTVNPELLEEWLHVKLFTIFINGPLIMHTFFVMSSFLLVYIWLIQSEKHEPSWKTLPKQFIMRWLRLTPSYGLVIALSATWFGRLASGPYWQKIIYTEVRDCRNYWWRNILYINNYIHGSHCMPHSWYLAADTQLHLMGIIIFLMCKTALTRKVVLSIVFVLGIIAPVLHTYYQHLNGVLVATPDTVLNLFMDDATFNTVYINGHTNMSSYVIGMAIGYIIYNWQKAGGNPRQFWKYRYLYWSTIFLGMLVCFSGSIFFADGPPQPVYVHLLYAAFMKPTFAMLIAIVLAGVVIQFEGIYRTILEWQPFMYMGRLSYSAYLIHIAFIRTDVVSIMSLQRISLIGTILKSTTIVTGIYIAAFFFWMLVESPFSSLFGAIFRKPETQTIEGNKEAVKESKRTEDDSGIDMSQTKIEDGTMIKMVNQHKATCT